MPLPVDDRRTVWQKCAGMIAYYLWDDPATTDHVDMKPLPSNNQSFAEWELRFSSVAGQYLGEETESVDGELNNTAGELVEMANVMISDEILENSTLTEPRGDLQKIHLFTEFSNTKRVDLRNFIHPTKYQPEELVRLATEYNEIWERQSTSSADPTYKRPSHGSRPKNTISCAQQHHVFSRSIWDILLQRSSCCTGSFPHHVAKIELIPFPDPSSRRNLPFRTFICSRSDLHPSTWHELQLNVKEDLTSTGKNLPDTLTKLCGMVGACQGNGQALAIYLHKGSEGSSSSITEMKPFEPTFGSALPGLSLATMIDRGYLKDVYCGGSFTLGDKASLLRTLALSLLCFPTASWFCGSWCAEDVYFLQVGSSPGDRVKNIDRPYQVIQIQPELPEANYNLLYLGSSPFILSFALLILEIFKGERIEILTKANMGATIFNSFNEMRGSLEKDLQEAICTLLNFDIQLPAAIGQTPDEKMRDLIYRKIVRPLEDYMDRFGQPIDERELKTRDKQQIRQVQAPRLREEQFGGYKQVRENTKAKTGHSCSIGNDYERETKRTRKRVHWENDLEDIESETSIESENEDETPCALLYDATDEYAGERTKREARKFFKTVDEFNDKFIRPLAKTSLESHPPWRQRPVRVAILDSGVNENDKIISAALEKSKIKDRKSWIGTGNDDVYGHGTHITRAFLRVAPGADLYIARISEGKKINPAQYESIAKAIQYAVSEWDVDIISMSLGLDEANSYIETEIDKALIPETKEDRKRIIFAAASNGGSLKGRTWPARKPGVICVNASDGHGASGGWMSPDPVEEDDNFMTLGIAIESKWEGARIHMSGTSLATPIAAALAASMLSFATIKIDMKEAEKLWLYSSGGIQALFKRVSYEKDEYRFLSPWKPADGKGPVTEEYLKRKVRKVLKKDYHR